jgi:REP element-mobilizing transposase RayT
MATLMTAPRLLRRGSTYLVTRRCLRGMFLLRPGKLLNQVFGYLLGRAAARTGVQIHAYCVLSNHFHLVVTDPGANLPLFHQYLDGLMARAMNALYGQWDAFWESDSYNAVVLDTPEDVVDRCAYVLANPVAAGLVRKARKWPGLWSSPADVGRTIMFERPLHFFNRKGYLPKETSLTLAVPPGFASAAHFRDRLAVTLEALEEKAARERVSFLGVARILRQRVLDRPASRKRRRRLRPRFAAGDHGRRLDLARRLKALLADYQAALAAWREGRRDVVFPHGTYQMRVVHKVLCCGSG